MIAIGAGIPVLRFLAYYGGCDSLEHIVAGIGVCAGIPCFVFFIMFAVAVFGVA